MRRLGITVHVVTCCQQQVSRQVQASCQGLLHGSANSSIATYLCGRFPTCLASSNGGRKGSVWHLMSCRPAMSTKLSSPSPALRSMAQHVVCHTRWGAMTYVINLSRAGDEGLSPKGTGSPHASVLAAAGHGMPGRLVNDREACNLPSALCHRRQRQHTPDGQVRLTGHALQSSKGHDLWRSLVHHIQVRMTTTIALHEQRGSVTTASLHCRCVRAICIERHCSHSNKRVDCSPPGTNAGRDA